MSVESDDWQLKSKLLTRPSFLLPSHKKEENSPPFVKTPNRIIQVKKVQYFMNNSKKTNEEDSKCD